MFVILRATIETRWSDATDFVGLRAVLYDVDAVADDLLAEGVVGGDCVVSFRFDPRRIRSLDSPTEAAPDLRLVIAHADGRLAFRSRVIANATLPAAIPADGLPLPLELTFVESSLE